MVQQVKEALSTVEGVHVLGLLFLLLIVAHLIKPADQLIQNSANYLMVALLTAMNVGPNQQKGQA